MNEEIDPLTAPIEQVIGSTPQPTPAVGPGDELVAPATPPEFAAGVADYGPAGPAPVPPIEAASEGSTRNDPPLQTGSRCECANWEVVNQGTGEVVERTDCEAVCKNKNSRFAPGHDARFKGMLIRAGERDYRVREVGTEQLRRPTTVAGRISGRLARQVEAGIERRKK